MPSRATVLAALLTVQVFFGLNYVISKVVVEAFPPLVWASVRIIIATIAIFLFAIVLKRPRPKGSFKEFYGPLIGFSLLGCVINQSSFLIGLSYTTSTNSAVLNTLIPVFTLLIVTLRGQEALTFHRVLGFICALGGVLVIRKIEDFRFTDKTLIGDLLMILNCLSYGLYLSYSKRFLEKYDRMWVTGWLFAYGSVGLTILAIPDYMTATMPVMTTELWWCAVFAILGGTLITYFLNNWALAYTHSSNVALWIYVQPVVAAALAYFWKGEEITSRTVLSTFLIFIGMTLALSRKSGQPRVLKGASSEL